MENFAKYVYELMNGYACVEQAPPALRLAVLNEFVENRPCEKWCGEIYEARLRLAARLGTDEEDADILTIVDGYERIAQYLAEKMYAYGGTNLQDYFS